MSRRTPGARNQTQVPDLLAELSWRGLVQEASQGLAARLARGPISGYIGFDASATSLHVGHLLQVFLLTHLQRAGGRPVVVIGGATGMIGDPSGKSSERKLLDDEAISRNAAAIKGQLESFLDFSPGPTEPLMVDNREWLGRYTMLEFLREIGKHFSIPYMLAKDSVQQRLGGRHELHRVQLHDAPVGRLPAPAPRSRRGAAARRRRPVGQHHGRPGADPARRGARGRGGGECLRAGVAAAADPRRREDGQVRARRDLPGPGAHVAVRVLPVLAQRRGRAGRPAPALADAARLGRDPAHRGGAGGPPGSGRRTGRWRST